MSWFLLRWILHSKSFNWSGRTKFMEFCARCSVLWKMATVTKAKTTSCFCWKFGAFSKALKQTLSSPNGLLLYTWNGPKNGSWSRVGYHCHISRQNRRKFCEHWQHTHSRKQDQLLQLLAEFCWKFGEAIGAEWRGLEFGKKRNRESREALEFFFGFYGIFNTMLIFAQFYMNDILDWFYWTEIWRSWNCFITLRVSCIRNISSLVACVSSFKNAQLIQLVQTNMFLLSQISYHLPLSMISLHL